MAGVGTILRPASVSMVVIGAGLGANSHSRPPGRSRVQAVVPVDGVLVASGLVEVGVMTPVSGDQSHDANDMILYFPWHSVMMI